MKALPIRGDQMPIAFYSMKLYNGEIEEGDLKFSSLDDSRKKLSG